MITKVGEAVIEELKDRRGLRQEIENLDDYVLEEIQEAAGRAALEAMLEPSKRMLLVGNAKLTADLNSEEVFIPMIRQALKEKQ